MSAEEIFSFQLEQERRAVGEREGGEGGGRRGQLELIDQARRAASSFKVTSFKVLEA